MKRCNLTTTQAISIIIASGIVVFFSGLTNAFAIDDFAQMVDNLVVHSISHIGILFNGSTFYVGGGLAPLNGGYYRPLMMTVFSLLSTLAGNQPFYYHLFQLLIAISSSIFLLFFRYSFKPALALFLALVFLVHPANSQNVFYISAMQDALFFFFGIVALWMLLRFDSVKSLFAVSLCLFLSLLSKETGILFIPLALLYLYWWNRERLFKFAAIIAPLVALWVILKIHAVGLAPASGNSPIGSIGLGHRLLNIPYDLFFYLRMLIFPGNLAFGYSWVHSGVSLRYFWLPLFVVIAFVAAVIGIALMLRRQAKTTQFLTFLFFSIWAFIGMLPSLQLVPLDFTASETWLYFSVAGLLGMIGVVATTFKMPVKPKWIVTACLLLVVALGTKTAIRGFDWRDQVALSKHDIAVSKENYTAMDIIAENDTNKGDYSAAEKLSRRSIAVYPSVNNFYDLGAELASQQKYSQAITAYKNSLLHGYPYLTYQKMAPLILVYEKPSETIRILSLALKRYPHQGVLWTELAIAEAQNNNSDLAKVAITEAASFVQVPTSLYDGIMKQQPFAVYLPEADFDLHVQ